MAMTFNKIIFILIFFFNPFKIFTNCLNDYPSATEIEIRSLNLKINYFCFLVSDFDKWLTREDRLLNEMQCEYDEFLQYISCLTNEKKLKAAQLRLLRWINILNRKLFRTNFSLQKEYDQINYEISPRYIECNLEWLEIQKLTCNNEILKCVKDTIERLKNLQLQFEETMKKSESLKQNLFDLNTETQTKLCDLKSICCFWY